ncbi:CDP-glucose 4,6-dehydratase [Segetibacter aerophilus]|uniref:CDP-glucose 4,6-dehydratase n=1 Tax=Segetibacter aerophilus TaxID=670293 RepID=A0A512BI04_9BACT|nr:CDP-glucose 4,6-dehydratase [Segetibacter aerophilus]GEO11614.1 CDP-glucose 4,6-dehydratase [Segetibacter aerophilus]
MFDTFKQTYQGKRIFLTGHTGFKGSWLLKILTALGAEVKGYALPPITKNDLYNLVSGDTLCQSIIADLRDRERLAKEITEFEPDFIFHLAAQPLVRLSYKIPAETFEVNVIGTANLLDSVRKLKKPCSVVLITTDKVYQNNEWVYPYRENDWLGGYDPYSASKACSELVIDSYRNSFFNVAEYSKNLKGVAVARAGNVIGGGDWSQDRLVPDIARSLGSGEKIKVRNPSSIRPWQHVLEPLVGYLELGRKLFFHPQQFSQAYNFGPLSGDSLSVQTIVDLSIKIWGTGGSETLNVVGEPHEAGLLKLDISKATTELGWQPKWNATEAIRQTIDWYKTFFSSPETIHSFTDAQVNQYLNDQAKD